MKTFTKFLKDNPVVTLAAVGVAAATGVASGVAAVAKKRKAEFEASEAGKQAKQAKEQLKHDTKEAVNRTKDAVKDLADEVKKDVKLVVDETNKKVKATTEVPVESTVDEVEVIEIQINANRPGRLKTAEELEKEELLQNVAQVLRAKAEEIAVGEVRDVEVAPELDSVKKAPVAKKPAARKPAVKKPATAAKTPAKKPVTRKPAAGKATPAKRTPAPKKTTGTPAKKTKPASDGTETSES